MTASAAFALLLCTLAVLGACGSAEGSALDDLGPDEALVARVVDGDTVRLRFRAGEEAVRLIGIDTPESVKPGSPVECYGREAAARLRALLPRGAPVRLERDVEGRDRYGRLLAYVFRRRDGLFVNLALAREGYAQQATYPPNVAYVERFTAAVAEAREANRGLWARCRDPARAPPPGTTG